MVTANCEAALRRLRNANSKRILWVDAICINQDDPTERSQQVTLMRDIYRNASNILAWLGKTSIECDPDTSQPYSDIGIDCLYRLGYEAIQRSELDEESDRFTSPLYSVLQELRRRDMEDAIAQETRFSRPNNNSFTQLLESCLGNSRTCSCTFVCVVLRKGHATRLGT